MKFRGKAYGRLNMNGYLRVEISTGRIFLLPLNQFAFAEMDNDGKEQLLHLSFATHEIMVRGHALRRIETALPRGAREVPRRKRRVFYPLARAPQAESN